MPNKTVTIDVVRRKPIIIPDLPDNWPHKGNAFTALDKRIDELENKLDRVICLLGIKLDEGKTDD